MNGWRLDGQGWLPVARLAASPNCDRRPAGVAVELLVIHNISLPPGAFDGDAVERLFTNRLDPSAHPWFGNLAGVRVSAHFFIRRDGTLTQFVSCRDRAWHAGASSFEGRDRCNDFSLGVELEGTDFAGYERPQYSTLSKLTRALRADLPLRAVRGHVDIARDRKTDPGPFFDWRTYAMEAGLPTGWLPAAAGTRVAD